MKGIAYGVGVGPGDPELMTVKAIRLIRENRVIAMPGTEEMGVKVNSWLKKWQDHTEESMPGDMSTTPGAERQDFLIEVTCPRFGNGECKGMIKESIRGYDMYILCDPGAYNIEYEMFGQRVPMSPDEHFANLKRIIAAMGGKAKRVTVIMPLPSPFPKRGQVTSIRKSCRSAPGVVLMSPGMDSSV